MQAVIPSARAEADRYKPETMAHFGIQLLDLTHAA